MALGTDTLRMASLSMWGRRRYRCRRLDAVIAGLVELQPDVICLQQLCDGGRRGRRHRRHGSLHLGQLRGATPGEAPARHAPSLEDSSRRLGPTSRRPC